MLAIIFVLSCSKKNNDKKILLVIIGAKNCHACEGSEKLVSYMENNYKLKVKYADINSPIGNSYVNNYQLLKIPTYLFLDDSSGRELYRLEGKTDENALKNALEIAKIRL